MVITEPNDRSTYRMGYNANLAGNPRDARQSIDWLRGWDDAQDDRGLDEDQQDD